jgi:phage/plasmid-associated DNA primase
VEIDAVSQPDTHRLGIGPRDHGAKVDDLDADLDLLNTPSGVVDLTTGEMTPHDPELMMTKITSGSYRLNTY